MSKANLTQLTFSRALRSLVLALVVALAFVGFSATSQAFVHDPGHEHDGMAAHLMFAGGTIHAHVFWEQGPSTKGESILRVEFKDGRTHQPVEPPGIFDASLWMPSMGHGSSPAAITRVTTGDHGQTLVGVYRVSNLYFVMEGDWLVRFSLKSRSNSASETKTMSVHVN